MCEEQTKKSGKHHFVIIHSECKATNEKLFLSEILKITSNHKMNKNELARESRPAGMRLE
jgi:hypothetical protein